MATWSDVLSDRSKYPDAMEVDMSGEKVKLGDLRNAVIPKGDFTKATQDAAAKERHLAEQLGQAQTALAQALAKTGTTGDATSGDDLDQFADDPVLKPFVNKIRSLTTKLDEAHGKLQSHEQQYWLGQHVAAIRAIQSTDEEFRKPEKVQELLQTMQTHGLANVSVAHQLLTRDRDLAKAKADADTAGYQRGKAEASVPHIPTGRPPRREAGSDVPPTFGRASEDAALRDPDIHKAMVSAE